MAARQVLTLKIEVRVLAGEPSVNPFPSSLLPERALTAPLVAANALNCQLLHFQNVW